MTEHVPASSSGEMITLLIANYNNGQYLPQCLQSLRWQTSDRWRAVICDDAGSDDSGRVYRELESDDRFRVIRNDTNVGYTASLKRLIEAADTDIVGILDPDDELDVTCIEKVMACYAQHAESGFVYTNFVYCDHLLRRKKNGYCRRLPEGMTSLDIDCVGAFRTFRRSVYARTPGLDEALVYAEDKDLILKLEEVSRPVFVDEPLYYYRLLPESQSHGERRRLSRKNYRQARLNAYRRRGRGMLTMLRHEGWGMLRDWLAGLGPAGIYARYRQYRTNRKARRREQRRIAAVAVRQRMGMDRNAALENLVLARDLFRSLGMTAWLTDGTLLGAYREHDFIGHDLDTDMGAFIDEFNPALFTAFVDAGWSLVHVFGRSDTGLEISFMRRGVKLDVFFFYRENGRVWHGAWLPAGIRGMRLIRYHYPELTFGEIAFLGQTFTAPADPLAYIRTKYGEGWNTPVKDWHWALSPANAEQTDFYLQGTG